MKALLQHLRATPMRVSSEALLQADVERALIDGDFSYKREFRLAPGERIDFMLDDGVGLECKARAKRREVYRQLERYAKKDQINSLILLTNTAMGLPPAINGKPLYYISCGRALL